MAHVIPNWGNGCDDSERPEADSTDVRCKICGIDGLSWIHTGVRWRLADSQGLHLCKPSADDFDVLD